MIRTAILLAVIAVPWSALPAAAQRVVTRAMRIDGAATISVRNQIGSVRVIGWDRDSLMLRGTFADDADILFGGGGRAAKVGVWDWGNPDAQDPSHFTVWVPRGSRLEIKTVSANITVAGVAGAFGSADGHIEVSGTVDRVEAESISGNVDVRVQAPWVRVRSGGGTLSIRGAIEDLGASTVSGRLTAEVAGVLRGSFTTVSGDVVYAGDIVAGGLYEFDSHSGAVEMRIPPETAASFDLASVVGVIDNGLTGLAPTAGSDNRGQYLKFAQGGGRARIVARSLRGAILLRPAPAR